MIRFNSKIGTLTFLIFALCCVLNIFFVLFWGLTHIWIPALIITIINTIFVFPKYFGTFYYLTETHLKINSYFFLINRKIKYEDIVVVVPFSGMKKLEPALCSEGIKVVYLKDGKTKEIFISPAMSQMFLEQLTDNIMYATVLNTQAKQSPETTQYLLMKQEVEEEKAKTLKPVTKQKKKATKKTVKKTTANETKKTVKKTVKPASNKKIEPTKLAKKVVNKKANAKAKPKAQAKKAPAKAKTVTKKTSTKKTVKKTK